MSDSEEFIDQPAIDRWRRLVRHSRRIRRLQMIWAHLGVHLRDHVSRPIREQLKKLKP